MAMDIVNIVGETTDYERKRQLDADKPKSWCKSVSAFANGRGGTLIFGVDDDGAVLGVENPQQTADKFSEIVRVKLDPVPDFELTFKTVDGKTLMLVNVMA